ncbi:MAG: hypothetical protein KJ907_07045 [Actinobacteria bacterium]|nr:hypothetical protein [Planctomycetota bacterium]MBU4402477.1 hypothetical protein [Actinomycetota bacterium]MBU4442094.1 hypothetical protein [Actinomycetota bacterium]
MFSGILEIKFKVKSVTCVALDHHSCFREASAARIAHMVDVVVTYILVIAAYTHCTPPDAPGYLVVVETHSPALSHDGSESDLLAAVSV